MTTKILGLFSSVALAALMGSASQAHANPPAPPQEAIDACANLKDGAECTVSFHGKSIQAKCVTGPEGQGQLACLPPPPKPPQEAIDACANLKEDATCTVSFHGQSVQSKCMKGPDGQGQLACMPPHRQGHHDGPPQEAISACTSLKDGATCTLSFHGNSVQGTCGKGPGGSETLACMPSPPPEAIEACANLTDDATCTVSHHGRDMEGKCKTPPSGSGQLACMPSHPPRN
jgi:hypothetical protein